jgi:hypothetical protein
MKLNAIAILLAVLLINVQIGFSQGTFQNLNFEQADPVFVSGLYSPSEVTSASAFPGWTVLIGGVQQSVVTENDPSTGASWVELVGPGSHFGFSPIDGNYSVLLQSYGAPATAAISQSGLIPVGSESLLFKAEPPAAGPVGPLSITVGSQTVPYTEVGSGANYILYGANISAWAGQTEALTFTDLIASGNWEIDDISFSPNAVTPEPSPPVLTGLGGLVFALHRRFAPKRPSR